ncbi:MAG: TetR/AcrR family transcriptional repressor of nem operon [Planctomycetota bacterium]|jgi:TetR/AcrR family transcriptional repressor of nem operon
MGSKENLITAATKLFYRKGYGSVGTKEICEAAGVNKGTFYHFFPSKSALARDALTNYAMIMSEKNSKILANPVSAREKLELVCDSFLAVNHELAEDDNIHGCLLGNIALELSHADEMVGEHINQLMKHNCAGMALLVQELIEEYQIEDPIEAEEGARRIMAYVEGCLMFAKAHNNLDELRSRLDGCIGLLYKSRPSGASL